MEKILIISGVSIFGILGTLHLIGTFFTRVFDPKDLSLVETMREVPPNFAKTTTMWRAWVGFNASHSLGIMLVAGIYVPLTLFHFEVIQQSLWFSLLPVFLGLVYFALARAYWFIVPVIGSIIATTCFVSAAILIHT